MSPSSAFCVLALLLAIVAAPARTQTTVRPYKFGFIIDEQQHRSEKRDERGIVMGEFGFITADGIYHVTVYATDEEGKFRILAMRNYPYESPPKTIDMLLTPQKKAIPTTTTTTTMTPVAPSPKKALAKFNFRTEACSGCFLTNIAPEPQLPAVEEATKTPIRPLSKPLLPNGVGGKAPGGTATGATKPTQPRPPITVKVPGKLPAKSGGSAAPPRTKAVSLGSSNGSKATNGRSSGTNPTGQAPSVGKAPQRGGSVAGLIGTGAQAFAPPRSGSGSANGGGGGSNGRGVGSAGGAGGESGDLYRFKYLLDYNGHSETGARNGNKEGNFYAIGDDNVERTIEYTANEFGFQPRIRWRKLETPPASKENTLKDYEFVWFKKPQQ